MTEPLELIKRQEADATLLTSPEVGLFTAARPEGSLFVPGETVGYLTRLGRSRRLVVPAGAAGRVTNPPPERVHAPVEYGQVLYRLEPVGDTAALVASAASEVENSTSELAFSAPQTGRFWHRPSPDEPAFCQVGDELEPGSPVGLIEIMKTFTQVNYTPTGHLPTRARVTRIAIPDGGEVSEGEVLLELEPA